MSLQCSERVWKCSSHKGSERLVLLAIARYAKDDGTGAWPSVPTLADDTGLTVRSVQFVLRKLVASGELVIDKGAGPNRCNLYRILIGRGCKDFTPENIAPVKNTTLGGEKYDVGMVKPDSPDPSIDPSVKEEDAAARVRESKIRPVPKNESARRPASHTPTPSSAAPPSRALPLGDGQADIEALTADPLLWQLAGAWADVAGVAVHELTAANGASLQAWRVELGDGLKAEHIAQAKRITGDNRPNNPTAFFRKLLGDAVAGKLHNDRRTKPGNGHAENRHTPPAQVAGSNPTGYVPPPPRAPCGFRGCEDPVAANVGAKYCLRHGEPKGLFRELRETFELMMLGQGAPARGANR